MTATTSKLGADMTDEQIESARGAADKECPLGPVNVRWYRAFARALLARQPAAIDKQDGRRRFSSADEFDKWAAASEEESAPSVEQDERGAQRKVIEPLKEPVSIKKALLGGMTAQVSSSQAVGQPASHAVFLVNIQLTGWSSDKVRAEGFADGFNKAAEWMQSAMSARAASTSANVAQGAEALADDSDWRDIDSIIRMLAYSDAANRQRAARLLAKMRGALTAPLAQTALTDDARDVKLEALNILHELSAVKRYSLQHHAASKGRTSSTLNVPNELLARIDALTAAQSASGDTK